MEMGERCKTPAAYPLAFVALFRPLVQFPNPEKKRLFFAKSNWCDFPVLLGSFLRTRTNQNRLTSEAAPASRRINI
jgi:hypothetical protein